VFVTNQQASPLQKLLEEHEREWVTKSYQASLTISTDWLALHSAHLLVIKQGERSMQETIQIGDISVLITRTNVKNVHHSVHPPGGRVTMAAPVENPASESHSEG